MAQEGGSLLPPEGQTIAAHPPDRHRQHLRADRAQKTLHPETVRLLAEDILENGLKTPIQVRNDDGKRFVLVEGLHRLGAAKWLGEKTIDAYLVQAKRH